MEQLQQTQYVGSPHSENRQASRMIVLAGTNFYDYDLKAFGKDRILFGRDPDRCDIVIPMSTISEVHGKIKFANGKTYVGDVGSTNGTYLYRGEIYEWMKPRKYYQKESGDWILRIDAKSHVSNQSAVIILTDSLQKSAWQCQTLTEGLTLIGRGSDNTIVMDSPGISRKHAAIMNQNGVYTIIDYGSMNGVYVNGKRVNRDEQIAEKDMIQIANFLFFVVDGKLLYQGAMSGVSLRLENISKEVGRGAGRKKILNQVYGDIGSNEFVAIIGGSGAGKTTVMNAMSGFDRDIEGNVFCNGIDLRRNFNSLKNMIGFVPQQDIIYENLKLKKMLLYTAKMKMPSDTTRAEMELRIYKVLEMVDLTQHADTYIRKLSGGQKKRASIAVELLADPGLFFLDEPTSGLDPDTEQSLMHTLASLSKSEGKTIIMVTHTTQSIHLCDKVIFMGPGGKICYCGPPSEMNEYFGKQDLVEIYNELAVNTDNWNGYYLQNYWQKRQEEPALTKAEDMFIKNSARRNVSWFKQLRVLTARYMNLIKNDYSRLLLLLVQPVAIALLLFLVAQEGTFVNFDDTKSILFALSCSGIWIGLFNTIQEVCKERAILKREYMGNLRLSGYVLSKYIVQGIICLIQATLLTTIFLNLLEHTAKGGTIWGSHPGMEIWLTMVLTIFASASMGLIVSSLVRNADRAMAFAPFVLIVQLLFSGVLFALGDGALVISKITVSRWSMECLGNTADLNALPYKEIETETGKLMKIPAKPYEDFFVRTSEHLWHTWLILLLIMLICGVASTIVLRNLKKDKR